MITIHLAEHEVRTSDKDIHLPMKEFLILKTLMGARGKVMTRAQLLKTVWGAIEDITTRTVDQHIARLRKKLGQDAKHLITVPLVGYKWKQ